MWMPGRAEYPTSLHVYVAPEVAEALNLRKLHIVGYLKWDKNVPKITEKVIARRVDQSLVVK